MGEIAKERSLENVKRRLYQIHDGMPPYGDQPRDYYWNTRGMSDARAKR